MHSSCLIDREGASQLRALIEDSCERINSQIESLDRIHVETPDPRVKPRFQAPHFTSPFPMAPTQRIAKWWERLVPGRLGLIASENERADEDHKARVKDWTAVKQAYDREIALRKALVKVDIYRDLAAMESFLAMALQDVAWPRETEVTFDIKEGGATAMLDVDLPEIEDMPTRLAAVPARGLRLSVKELSATKVQKMYMARIHGIAFRIIGETFAALPLVKRVVLSAYSQRRSATTAQLGDEYLLSVRVDRNDWETIDFTHLESIDVVEALTRFELRRTMSKTGVFKSIQPFEG